MSSLTDQAPVRPVPVSLLTGFLGAGKTTLLNRIMQESHGQRIGIVVNDFGAINIDAKLVVAVEEDRIALANGCICCAAQDNLEAAICQIVANGAVDRIIVECSGVVQTREVLSLIARTAAPVRPAETVCLIDALNFAEMDYQSTELAIDQAAASDLVLLNKCDLASPTRVGNTKRVLLGAQPSMRIVETRMANLPLEALIDLPVRDDLTRTPFGEGFVRTHSELYFSWSCSFPNALDYSAFCAAVSAFPDEVFRAKGVLTFTTCPGVSIFQLAGKRSTIEPGPPGSNAETGVLTVIGCLSSRDRVDIQHELETLFTFANARQSSPFALPDSSRAFLPEGLHVST